MEEDNAKNQLGCYCVSQITWLLGQKPIEVKGLAEYNEEKIDSFATAYMKYENGIRASFNSGMVLDAIGYN